jgi:lactate dehydrogenase-like 2-hydroxyacid dehydrogenase
MPSCTIQTFITPHIAYDTGEARRRIIESTLANIRAYAAGSPQNFVGGPTP